MIPNDRTTHFLSRLETGFRMDAARLETLEQDLTAALQRARHFGTEQGGDWNTGWQQQWDHVEELLRRIRWLVDEMESSIDSSDPGRLKASLASWETIQAEDAKLVAALAALRTHAVGLNPDVRDDWSLLARTLESHVETIRSCAQALRIKIELLQKHSKAEVDQLVLEILARLPDRARTEGMSAEIYAQEYAAAAQELDKEHHKFLGFVDAVKALLLWVESPEERTDKNLSKQTAPALPVPIL